LDEYNSNRRLRVGHFRDRRKVADGSQTGAQRVVPLGFKAVVKMSHVVEDRDGGEWLMAELAAPGPVSGEHRCGAVERLYLGLFGNALAGRVEHRIGDRCGYPDDDQLAESLDADRVGDLIERLEHIPASYAPRDPGLNHNRRALMQHSAPGSARHRYLGIAVFAIGLAAHS
jgi:hypothetical protein